MAEIDKPSFGIKREVAEALANSGPKVRGLVLDVLTGKEIERRKDAVWAVIDKLDAKEKELRKAQSAGTVSFSVGGDVVGEPTFSKQQIEDMKKVNEEIGRLQGALARAFDSNDFGKLLEFAAKN